MSVANNETRKNSKVINKDVYIKDFEVKKSGCGETFVINFHDDIEKQLSNKKKKPLRLQQVRPKASSETRLKSASTLTSSSQVKKSNWRPKKKNHASKERGGQGGRKTLKNFDCKISLLVLLVCYYCCGA